AELFEKLPLAYSLVAQIAYRVMGRNVRIGHGIPFFDVYAVENAEERVASIAQNSPHPETVFEGLYLFAVAAAPRGYSFRIKQPAFERVGRTAEFKPPLALIEFFIESEKRQCVVTEDTVKSDVVYGQNGRSAGIKRIVSENRPQIDRNQRRHPIVAMDDVGSA